MNFMEIIPQKTVYERGSGTKYGLYSLMLNDGNRVDTIFKLSSKRKQVIWNKDNTRFAYADSGKILVRSVFEKESFQISGDTMEIIKNDTVTSKFTVMQWSPDQTMVLASTKKAYWLINADTREMKMVYSLPEDQEKSPRLSIAEWSPDGRYWYMTYSARDKWERGLV